MIKWMPVPIPVPVPVLPGPETSSTGQAGTSWSLQSPSWEYSLEMAVYIAENNTSCTLNWYYCIPYEYWPNRCWSISFCPQALPLAAVTPPHLLSSCSLPLLTETEKRCLDWTRESARQTTWTGGTRKMASKGSDWGDSLKAQKGSSVVVLTLEQPLSVPWEPSNCVIPMVYFEADSWKLFQIFLMFLGRWSYFVCPP